MKLFQNIIRLQEAESTNSFALDLLQKQHPAEGTVVVTSNQTHGCGLKHNTWESEPGKNLTFSFILYPQLSADRQFMLNMAVSLGIYDFLCAGMPDAEISIKWPNDLYAGNRKLCGMLIQNALSGYRFVYSVTGIGLNVNQEKFVSDAPNPVSMKMLTGKHYDLEAVLPAVLSSIENRYLQPGTHSETELHADYLAALYRIDQWHQYIIEGKQVTAMITGTNEYGQLNVTADNGRQYTCDLKAVKFIL